jgi:hypothetical protein
MRWACIVLLVALTNVNCQPFGKRFEDVFSAITKRGSDAPGWFGGK